MCATVHGSDEIRLFLFRLVRVNFECRSSSNDAHLIPRRKDLSIYHLVCVFNFFHLLYFYAYVYTYLQIIRHIQHNNYPSLFIIIRRSWCEKKESEISLFQLMKRSMESVINVIFMPSWEESNRSDRHGQLASYDSGGLYFVWLFLFHSRIEKIYHAIVYELCWLIHQINEVRAWWRAFAHTFVLARALIVSCRLFYFPFSQNQNRFHLKHHVYYIPLTQKKKQIEKCSAKSRTQRSVHKLKCIMSARIRD